DFPILSRQVHGRPLVYLDNAATTQKPQVVIDALVEYYTRHNANIHRGLHRLAEEATEAYEATREHVARFIHAASSEEIVFTRNTTEAINLVAATWGRTNVGQDDEIVVTCMEHHSNLVPWQMLAQEKGARLRFIGVDGAGELRREDFDLIGERTKLVALAHASNVLGTVNPVRELAERAHAAGALLLVDGAQSAPHMPVDVQALQCDFFAFSAHKMLGPTGVGVLRARRDLLAEMPPFLGGGEMVSLVGDEAATWNALPWKFEAGTPNIADVVAFDAALTYLEQLGMANVREHEEQIAAEAIHRLSELPGLTLHGPRDAARRGAAISFSLDGIHPHDIGTILDQLGIAIRAGQHCAQPLMRVLGVPATARASFYVYNTFDEIDMLIEGLREAQRIFAAPAEATLR
ncbi:MAG TPA: cysteine desulfurase, partial [Dehalococcoidia bacterium]|nr:cysteine desulfurase [Dehalococcoidia bacterium]